MNILIAKQNKDLVMDIFKAKSLNVLRETEHTLTFKVSKNRFNGAINEIRLRGYNPYALLTW